MTVGQALEQTQQLRPGSRIPALTLQHWLRDLDGTLRCQVFARSKRPEERTQGADLAWDDGLREEDVLLVPAPYDGLYPHYLCAQIDGVLGEADRYAGERAQYQAILAEFRAWMLPHIPALQPGPLALVRG